MNDYMHLNKNNATRKPASGPGQTEAAARHHPYERVASTVSGAVSKIVSGAPDKNITTMRLHEMPAAMLAAIKKRMVKPTPAEAERSKLDNLTSSQSSNALATPASPLTKKVKAKRVRQNKQKKVKPADAATLPDKVKEKKVKQNKPKKVNPADAKTLLNDTTSNKTSTAEVLRSTLAEEKTSKETPAEDRTSENTLAINPTSEGIEDKSSTDGVLNGLPNSSTSKTTTTSQTVVVKAATNQGKKKSTKTCH